MSFRGLLEEFQLPDFAGKARPAAMGPLSDVDIEALRSAAYEVGYSSGWEDAGKAQAEQGKHIDAELERCVQDLSFTFHEAVAQLRGELGTLMLAVSEQFIPEILPDLMRATLQEEILKIAEAALHPDVELVASLDTAKNFENTLPTSGQMELRVIAEPSLGPNQAFLRFQEQEIAVDFGPLLKTLKEQLAAFTQSAGPGTTDG
ncbi:MAG: hypothetical protein ACR2OY_14195 [Boseongicola sp.]